MSGGRRRVAFRVAGLVQGVAYRASAQRAAEAEGLVGWVRNREDGEVEGEAEGETGAIERFLDWCRVGPRPARVTQVSVDDLAPTGSPAEFEIRR